MKRRLLFIFLLVLMSVPFSSFAFDMKSDYDIAVEEATAKDKAFFDADEFNYKKTPLNKLGRGITNVFTCWAEVPAEFFKVSKDSNNDIVAGAAIGVPTGFALGLVRGVTGIIDAATFAIPPYDKPLMQPEFALQRTQDNFDYYLGK